VAVLAGRVPTDSALAEAVLGRFVFETLDGLLVGAQEHEVLTKFAGAQAAVPEASKAAAWGFADGPAVGSAWRAKEHLQAGVLARAPEMLRKYVVWRGNSKGLLIVLDRLAKSLADRAMPIEWVDAYATVEKVGGS
jgi:hypothetical protein